MTPRRLRSGVFLLVLLCLCMQAQAQTVFDVGPSRHRHVYELPVGGGYPYHHQSAVSGKGFHYANSWSMIYLVNVLPGSYSLALTCPADINMKPAVSIFDRWPYDSNARPYTLPMGPTVMPAGKKAEYRWGLGISPASTSTFLYIIVEVPAGTGRQGFFPCEVFITGQTSPMYTMKRGITFLSGPENLVLTSGQGSISYAVDTPGQTFNPDALPPMPIPGDLVQNGAFRDGLNHWTPHRDRVPADNIKSFSLKDRVLRIESVESRNREGLMQKINEDVSDVKSLILRADVLVAEQTQGGLGPEGKDAPIAIAVGYRDASGREEKKDLVFWKGFYCLEPEDTAKSGEGQKIPKGEWYRYIFDLMQLDPKPASILFISIEGSGWPGRQGSAREVHLIKSGGKK